MQPNRVSFSSSVMARARTHQHGVIAQVDESVICIRVVLGDSLSNFLRQL